MRWDENDTDLICGRGCHVDHGAVVAVGEDVGGGHREWELAVWKCAGEDSEEVDMPVDEEFGLSSTHLYVGIHATAWRDRRKGVRRE